jgi:hypothetical protein
MRKWIESAMEFVSEYLEIEAEIEQIEMCRYGKYIQNYRLENFKIWNSGTVQLTER